MAMLRKLAALGAAAEAARRYAQKNPDKVRELAEKAAKFADQQTKGKYTAQIHQAKGKVAQVAGLPDQPGSHNPGTYNGPTNLSGRPEQSPYSAPGQSRPTPFKRD